MIAGNRVVFYTSPYNVLVYLIHLLQDQYHSKIEALPSVFLWACFSSSSRINGTFLPQKSGTVGAQCMGVNILS